MGGLLQTVAVPGFSVSLPTCGCMNNDMAAMSVDARYLRAQE